MAGFFKKVLKGLLIGGGTALSGLCPAVGGAVVTAGMKIGAGATAIGQLIQTDKAPVTGDTTTTKINEFLESKGLTKPSTVIKGLSKPTNILGLELTSNTWLLVLAAVAAFLLLFKGKSR